ncbi:hypothetical protein A3Q37_06236 [Streptomyces sp. PTY087I2]|nr:hypothetical protein A3Q37_06236 [Streptomyces sp. PTY087I2]
MGGDGEQHVVLAQTVAVGGLVAPGLPGPPGEVAYVHHEELDALLVVQPVEGVLHLPSPVAQGPDPVGDLPVPGQLDGVVGARGHGGGEHHPAQGEQRGGQGGERRGGERGEPAGGPWRSRRRHVCEAMCAFSPPRPGDRPTAPAVRGGVAPTRAGCARWRSADLRPLSAEASCRPASAVRRGDLLTAPAARGGVPPTPRSLSAGAFCLPGAPSAVRRSILPTCADCARGRSADPRPPSGGACGTDPPVRLRCSHERGAGKRSARACAERRGPPPVVRWGGRGAFRAPRRRPTAAAPVGPGRTRGPKSGGGE